MIWVAIALLTVAALAPLTIALERRTAIRGAQALAVGLHRAQLLELDRDLAEGRVLPSEHAIAVLEVQRRLLAAAEAQESASQVGSRAPVITVAVLVPVAAVAMYLLTGQPGMPSVVPSSETARMQRAIEEGALIDQLRERVKALDPGTEQARQGYILLGNVEEARGNDAAAVEAWQVALRKRFDATLAVRLAVAAERVEGGLSTSSAAMLRRALAAAPPDAPWREAVLLRLKQAGL